MVFDELQRQREFLAIDKNRLDDCLIQQPEIYFHVATVFAHAVAERDALSLELEELQATLDQEFREKSVRSGEKLTEASIQNRLRTVPELQAIQRRLLNSKKLAGDWQALKEAFQQRSFMLRELVALVIAQRNDLALEGGAGQARVTLADETRLKAGEMRRQKRMGP